MFFPFYVVLRLLQTILDLNLRYPIGSDGHFLKKPIPELIQKHEFHTLPLMTGVNNDEGGWLLGNVSAKQALK